MAVAQPNHRNLGRLRDTTPGTGFEFLYFSQLLKRPICSGRIRNRIGKLTDMVFHLSEPYPEAVGLYVEHGWGKPTELIPWDKVVRIEDDAIFVKPHESGGPYPPFVDQKGWILVNEHLMGRTILDMDGRRVEVVNDVHLLESAGRMLIVHVDISFNGFLRRWGLGWIHWIKDQFISWRYVQPLSLEDAETPDSVTLSVTRKQMKDLPTEDLADVLEELSGREQEALFSALDSETAAEALMEAEPRAQRQLIAALRRERAKAILSEMSVPQLAALLSVLPHDDMMELLELVPKDEAERIKALVTEHETTARSLMSSRYLAKPKEARVGDVLKDIRVSGYDQDMISYIYVVAPEEKLLLGVVDLRDLLLADDNKTLGDLMVSPVVSAEENDLREDLANLFDKYHYRMLPVVDPRDHLLGVVHYKDIAKGQ